MTGASRIPQEIMNHIAGFGGIDIRIAFRIPPQKIRHHPLDIQPIFPPLPWPNSSEVGVTVWKFRGNDWYSRGFKSNYFYYSVSYCMSTNKRLVRYRPPRHKEITIELDP